MEKSRLVSDIRASSSFPREAGTCSHSCPVLIMRLLRGQMECRTGNGEKLSSSQAAARSGHQLSCCLVSLHFLCDILATLTVVVQAKIQIGKVVHISITSV